MTTTCLPGLPARFWSAALLFNLGPDEHANNEGEI